MNAMAIVPTNRCPDRYRGLSPQEECRLRSRILGTAERPGGLPKPIDNEAAQTLAASRRDAVMAAIIAGNDTRVKLRRVTHGGAWVDNSIETLVIQRRILAVHGKHSVRYEVVK